MKGDGRPTKTINGSLYMTSKGTEMPFFAYAGKNLPEERDVSIISYFMEIGSDISCDIDVNFGEPQSVERWTLEPEAESNLKGIVADVTAKEERSASAPTREKSFEDLDSEPTEDVSGNEFEGTLD